MSAGFSFPRNFDNISIFFSLLESIDDDENHEISEYKIFFIWNFLIFGFFSASILTVVKYNVISLNKSFSNYLEILLCFFFFNFKQIIWTLTM